MRKEFNVFFHFGQLPVVLGFDTIPFMSPSVFDVWNKADSTHWDTQMMDLQSN